MDRHQDVATCMRDLIRVRPDAAYPHGFLGTVVEKNGTHEALACYEKMLKIDPGDATSKWRRGLTMSATGMIKDDRCYWKELTSEPGSEIAGRIQNIIKTSVMNAEEQGAVGQRYHHHDTRPDPDNGRADHRL